MQGLAGEPGEIDDDVLGRECLLDVRAQAGGQHHRRRGRGRGQSRQRQRTVAIGRLEELLGGPAGEHFLEHPAVVGIRQAPDGAVNPAVELGAAGIASGQVRVDPAGGLVVLRAEGRVVLPVLFAQQDLEHYRLFAHVLSG